MVAGFVVVIVIALLVWGYRQAMRVPRIRRVDVAIDGLGRGLDGLRVAVITDTHYGPIDRSRWSAGVVARVNELDADIVCHVGDIADGTVDVREHQARPLASVRAASARVYVTGNHEYFSEAQGWLDYMEGIGWAALHNRHSSSSAEATASSSRAWMTPPPRRQAWPDTALTSTQRLPAPTPRCRCFFWHINRSR